MISYSKVCGHNFFSASRKRWQDYRQVKLLTRCGGKANHHSFHPTPQSDLFIANLRTKDITQACNLDTEMDSSFRCVYKDHDRMHGTFIKKSVSQRTDLHTVCSSKTYLHSAKNYVVVKKKGISIFAKSVMF